MHKFWRFRPARWRLLRCLITFTISAAVALGPVVALADLSPYAGEHVQIILVTAFVATLATAVLEAACWWERRGQTMDHEEEADLRYRASRQVQIARSRRQWRQQLALLRALSRDQKIIQQAYQAATRSSSTGTTEPASSSQVSVGQPWASMSGTAGASRSQSEVGL